MKLLFVINSLFETKQTITCIMVIRTIPHPMPIMLIHPQLNPRHHRIRLMDTQVKVQYIPMVLHLLLLLLLWMRVQVQPQVLHLLPTCHWKKMQRKNRPCHLLRHPRQWLQLLSHRTMWSRPSLLTRNPNIRITHIMVPTLMPLASGLQPLPHPPRLPLTYEVMTII